MTNANETRIYTITDIYDKQIILAAKNWEEAKQKYYDFGNLPVQSYKSKVFKG